MLRGLKAGGDGPRGARLRLRRCRGVGSDDRRSAAGDQVGRVPGGDAAGRRGRADPGRPYGAGRGRCRASAAGSPTPSTSRPGRPSSPTADEIWSAADLVVKVKEPLPAGVAAPSARPDALHLLPLRRRRAPDDRDHRQRDHGHRLRDPARRPGRASLADADERGRRADEHPGGGQVPRAAPGGARHPALGRAGRRPGRGRHPGRRRSSAPTRPRSPPAWARPSASSTSTSTGFAISTTSCRRTSPRSIPTGTRSSSRSSGPTWSSAPC